MHGFLLVGGEKMSKTRLNQIAPADLVADFGVDGFRYHFLRDTPFGPDGDFTYEGMVARYNADLANNLGNLLSRVATVVGKQVRRHRSRAAARQPARARRGRALRPTRPRRGSACSRPIALEATWRLIRETNAYLEANEPWKAEPGPEVDARARRRARGAAHRRRPGQPRPSRQPAAEIWRRIGLDGSPPTSGCPQAAAWGGYPGGLAVEKGAPLFPGISRALDLIGVVRWTDNHCHLDRRAAGRRRSRGDRRGADGGRRAA